MRTALLMIAALLSLAGCGREAPTEAPAPPTAAPDTAEWSVTVGENMARAHPAIGHADPAASEPTGK